MKKTGFGAKYDESDAEVETPVAENPSKKVKKEVAKPVVTEVATAEESDLADSADDFSLKGLDSDDDDDIEGTSSGSELDEKEDDAEEDEEDNDI